MARIWLCLVIFVAAGVISVPAQSTNPSNQPVLTAGMSNTKMETTDDWNRRLQELVHSAVSNAQKKPSANDYRIGPNDELAINVLDAPDLSNAVTVSGDGNISVPLLGTIKVGGLTPREVELVLQALLRRTYMKDPQVTVTVIEMQSHTVSVIGSVKNPGTFQIPGPKSLLEVLSMAGGIAPDAGNSVLVMRGTSAGFYRHSNVLIQNVKATGGQTQGSSQEAISSSDNTASSGTIEVNLKRLLESGDSKYNVTVYPGDIVKVKTAGIVYVVGDVTRPGGFPVQDNERMTVLQAIALGGGIAPNADKSKAKIIRVAQNGKQIQLPVHLGKILTGKSPDLLLQPKDVLFIPTNGSKAAGKAVLDTFSKWIVWRGMP